MAIRRGIKIYFDGGCRPLPIGMEICTLIAGAASLQRHLGEGSAMEAEWRALIFAGKRALENSIEQPIFVGDALAVIRQASGQARVPPAMAPYADHWRTLSQQLAPFSLRHVKRQQNLAGIALARLHPRG